jgi:hypothetical protein
MQLLTEQDDTRIGVETEQHEHAWSRVGHLILRHVEEFYEIPRKLKMGRGKAFTVKEVKGADLKGNTDVMVVRGSTLPGSKTLKRQEILNAYGQGLLGDPSDPAVREKVLGMVEFGDVNEIWKDHALDEAQIKRGIELLEQGQKIECSEFDNHALWVQELNRYRKSEKWDQTDPRIQLLFLETIEDHVQAIVKLTVPPELPLAGEEMTGEGTPMDIPPPAEGAMPLNENELPPGMA